MSNIMMPNIVSSARPDNRPDPKAQIDSGNEDNFSRYLDKKVQTERRERSNLVGAKRHGHGADKAPEPEEKTGTADETSAAAFLQQLLADLKDLAKKTGKEAGQWSFQLKSMAMLDKMAAQAGMSQADLASLKDQMQKEGTVNLADIFALLEQHFKSLQSPPPVTAPETDLPTLESLLGRMGVDADKLAELSKQSVDEEGKFDLTAYLQGLEAMSDSDKLQAVKVSALELANIQDMLAAAGVGKGALNEIFPEKIAAWQRDLAGLPPVADSGNKTMGLDGLKEMLEQGLAAVQEAKPKVNMPAFLQDLTDVLNQAGFVKGGVGFTPVVQESLTSAYQELLKMVNLVKVKIDKVNDMMSVNQGLAEQWQATGATEKIPETLASLVEGKTELVEAAGGNAGIKSSDTVLDKTANNDSGSGAETVLTGNTDAGQGARQAEFRMPVTAKLPTTQILQQFAMDQLSQGVTQALQRDEHHLTLTMYPKELGEVKVDLQVRNNHLAVSFVMDNHKVKEALEKNMTEFKDNLNRQGYNLEACAVLVDQHKNDSDGARQQFASAWEQLSVTDNIKRGPDADALAESMRQISSLRSERWPDSSISVFV